MCTASRAHTTAAPQHAGPTTGARTPQREYTAVVRVRRPVLSRGHPPSLRDPGRGCLRRYLVYAAEIWPTSVAKGMSSAAYTSPASGAVLSARISTIIVA